MLKHSLNEHEDLCVELWCDVCGSIVNDLTYAECVWRDKTPNTLAGTIVGHTKCTRQYDETHPNNISAEEYIARIGRKLNAVGKPE